MNAKRNGKKKNGNRRRKQKGEFSSALSLFSVVLAGYKQGERGGGRESGGKGWAACFSCFVTGVRFLFCQKKSLPSVAVALASPCLSHDVFCFESTIDAYAELCLREREG